MVPTLIRELGSGHLYLSSRGGLHFGLTPKNAVTPKTGIRNMVTPKTGIENFATLKRGIKNFATPEKGI